MTRSTLMTLLFSLLISACSTTPSSEPASPETGNTANQSSDQSAQIAQPATGAASAVTQPDTSALATQNAAATMVSIYFDKDQYAIATEYQSLLQQQAGLLMQDGKTVTLEGNADERGSSEYNLALGDRRAQAVRKSLMVLGVPADRIKVISYGEERPKQSCHEESCWHENRRVDFRY